jgi:DNA-binding response OmpR family regulator
MNLRYNNRKLTLSPRAVNKGGCGMTPRVLIIDDDPDLLRLVGLLLRRINVETVTATDGFTGLTACEGEKIPDLVILDLMLPDMDGFEVLKRMRANPNLNHIPVLILSAKADPNTIRQGLDLGADGYVTKPYIANSLLDRVRALLSAQRDQAKPE